MFLRISPFCSYPFWPFFSPQAIFKDPFRGGNNILVRNRTMLSNLWFLKDDWRLINMDFLRPYEGDLWFIHPSWRANSNKQTARSCWDLQQSEGHQWSSMVCCQFHTWNFVILITDSHVARPFFLGEFRYGIEQEYTLLQTNVKWPLGWPVGGYPGPQVSFFTTSRHKPCTIST